jgi:hypothetical protein
VGAIAGGVVGGVVIIAALVALFFWRRKVESRRKLNFTIEDSQIALYHSITPFICPIAPETTTSASPDQGSDKNLETLFLGTRTRTVRRTKPQRQERMERNLPSSSRLGRSSGNGVSGSIGMPDEPPPQYCSEAGI